MRPQVALLILLVLAPTVPAQAADTDGCREEADTFVCEWTIDTTQRLGALASYEVPVFDSTLATLIIRLEGKDNGWRVAFQREGADQPVSTTRHTAPAAQLALTVTETTTHVLDGRFRHWLTFVAQNHEAAGLHGGAAADSMGVFTIVYQAERLPEGVVPARPAATREVPQFSDVARDARRPELDILAAWIDDARLHDGLMDVHMALMSLDDVETNVSAGNLPARGFVQWQMHFLVLGQRYVVEWTAHGNGTQTPRLNCALYRTTTGTPELLGSPLCRVDLDTAELHAVFPERSIGSPGSGERFHELSVNADYVMDDTMVTVFGARVGRTFPDPQDSAIAQFGYAPGGPDVWDAINPELRVESVQTAWFEAPLAEDNIPDTLQVAGAAAAVITFLVGLLLVRRRRGQTKALLAEIARVEREHETDTRGALLALGSLDSRFARLYHAHDITDEQYQVVSQRLATVATRFALRQGLGLDDGVPGAGGPAERPARVIPLRDALREVEP